MRRRRGSRGGCAGVQGRRSGRHNRSTGWGACAAGCGDPGTRLGAGAAGVRGRLQALGSEWAGAQRAGRGPGLGRWCGAAAGVRGRRQGPRQRGCGRPLGCGAGRRRCDRAGRGLSGGAVSQLGEIRDFAISGSCSDRPPPTPRQRPLWLVLPLPLTPRVAIYSLESAFTARISKDAGAGAAGSSCRV